MDGTSGELAPTVELAAVYKLPAAITVAGACLGVAAPVRLAGLDGEVRLPTLTWVGGEPRLIPPSLADLPGLAGERLLEPSRRQDFPMFWGIPDSYDTVTREVVRADVGALLFRFSGVSADGLTYSNYLYGRGHPIGAPVDGLFEEIETWFDTLRTWIRAFTDQDVDPVVEAGQAVVMAEGFEVLAVDGETVSIPRLPFSRTANMRDLQALDERHWKHVLNLTSQGAVVPVAYLLAGSARVQLGLRQYRLAVIETATAVELAVTDFLSTHYASLPQGAQNILNNRPTLGALIKNVAAIPGLPPTVARTYGNFPADHERNFLDVRNAVVHRNHAPTHAQASRVLEIALDIIKLLQPLPQVPAT